MSRNGRIAVLIAVLAVGCIAVAYATRATPAGLMDLDSSEADGAKGLRLLLEHDGSTVTSAGAADIDTAAATRFDTVFIPDADGASDAQIAAWRRYVTGGGHLVLGTPVPALGARAAPDASDVDAQFGPALDLSGRNPGECTMSELTATTELEGVTSGIKITGPAAYLHVGANDQSCYGSGDRALIVTTPDSRIVNIGVPNLFDNRSMGAPEAGETQTDVRANAAVASALLAPAGPSEVAIVTRGISRIVTDGGTSPFGLLRPGIRAGLWELAIAVAFFAWWRGRRHGRVVREAAPTHLAASELVDAVGNLLERQGDASNAAEVIRASVARDLTVRLGLPAASDAGAFARLLSPRTGHSIDELNALFVDPVPDDAALQRVAGQLESLRHEVLHV